MPELKFRKTADEGAKFLILFRGEAGCSIFHFVIYGFVAGIEFWLQKGQEKVEEVDSQGICHCKHRQVVVSQNKAERTNIPPLRHEYSDEEDH